jgi:Ca-activated chloride channel family protein
LNSIGPRGGTNIHDALLEALKPKPLEGMLPIVLFLTDGLPTVGQTSESSIRDLALKGNIYNRRIFTFGVGFDVNTPLLQKIAFENRGAPSFVMANEDVEVKMGQVWKRLSGPILTEPEISIVDSSLKPSPGRISEIIPTKLSDLFDGDQLILLGQYKGNDPLNILLKGSYLGKERTFKFSFDLDKTTVTNSFVPRLWASRKIAVLSDSIRQTEANSTNTLNPKQKELVDEIVRLSTEFGILTEYTSFLALEGTDLSNGNEVLAQAESNFVQRAQRVRSGKGSFNQELNNSSQMQEQVLNIKNAFYDKNLNKIAVSNVQQISNSAFYNRNGRWIESSVINKEKEMNPKRVIEFGSEQYREITNRLIKDGRQAAISLKGEILIVIDGEPILIKGI